MKTIRKTFVWMFVIAATLVGGVAWWGYDFWTQKNEFVRQTILSNFAEMAPEWELTLGSCQFDFLRKIQITDLSLRRRIDDDALTNIEQCVVTIDRDKLFDNHEFVIQHVKLTRPTLKLEQDAAGRWAWQDFPSSGESTQTPEVEIEQGTVSLQFWDDSRQSNPKVTLTGVNLKLIPDGNRQFLIEAVASLDEISSIVKLDGKWNLDHQTGSINGQIMGLTVDDKFVQTIGNHIPQVAEKLSELRERLVDRITRPFDPSNRASISLNAVGKEISEQRRRDGSGSSDTPPMLDRDVLLKSLGGPALGLIAKTNVNFRIARWKEDAVLESKVLLTLTGGTIDNPILPYRLTNLTGKLYFDNRQILVRDLAAVDGKTRFDADGRLRIQDGIVSGEFNIDATNMICDDRIRSRLSPRIVRVFDMHQPRGTFDASVTVVNDGSGVWKAKDMVLTAKGISARNDIFPYPATGITGTIKQVGPDFEFDLRGLAGQRPAWLAGIVQRPGPNAQTVFDIRVNELPIDNELLSASRNLKGMQRTLQALQLSGMADVHLRLTKVGTGPFYPQVLATFKQCSLQYEHFAYPLTNLSGTVGATGTTWTFKNLKARHGSARLTGSGAFTQPAGQHLLELTVRATDVQLDKDLYRAVPESLQRTWSELAIGGKANLTTKITWSDPKPPEIAIPEIDVINGRMQIQSFPYRIEGISTKLAYDPAGVLTIKSFQGQHGDTVVRGRGFGHFKNNGDWTIRLNSLDVENLMPDTDLRVALSDDLRQIVECLDPNQVVSLNGMLELRGTQRPDLPVTAAWDLKTGFSGGNIAVGMDLKNTRGVISSRGTWDGNTAAIAGNIDLETTTVLGYRIDEVRGPYQVDGNKIIIGNGGSLEESRDGSEPVVADRVSGRAIGGIVKLDALAFLNDEPNYRVKLDLSHGKLERYADEYMAGQQDLRGVMNGWIDLRGRGPSTDSIVGRGQLQISPAALYELPVMAQVFGALQTGVPDSTAFRYALLDFNVAKSMFLFNGIDLIGETISLHSRGGRAGFDGKLEMDFYSRLPRAQLPLPLPFIKEFLGQATTGWVSVEVRGSTDKPVAKIKPAPLLNEAVKQFLQAFELRQPLQPSGVMSRPRLPTVRNRRTRDSARN